MPDKKLSSVIMELRRGERMAVADDVTVELLHKSGQLARFRVTAPRTMRITKAAPGEKETEKPEPSMAT